MWASIKIESQKLGWVLVKHADVTIVIQGPSVSVSGKLGAAFRNLENYSKHVGNIVISTWDDSKVKPSKRMLNRLGIKYVEDSKDHYKNHYNSSNIAYQSATSLNGLKLVKTEYAIKVRCDEKYTDISKFIKVMKSAPEKITTSNFLFTSDDFSQFHISDHVIGGKTENLIGMFDNTSMLCKHYTNKTDPITGSDLAIDNYRNGKTKNDEISPESLLFLCFLAYKEIEIDCSKSIEIMNDNCQLVELTDMGDFLCHMSCIPYTNYDRVLEDTATITSMNDL